jgi:hypothetical protein
MELPLLCQSSSTATWPPSLQFLISGSCCNDSKSGHPASRIHCSAVGVFELRRDSRARPYVTMGGQERRYACSVAEINICRDHLQRLGQRELSGALQSFSSGCSSFTALRGVAREDLLVGIGLTMHRLGGALLEPGNGPRRLTPRMYVSPLHNWVMSRSRSSTFEGRIDVKREVEAIVSVSFLFDNVYGDDAWLS